MALKLQYGVRQKVFVSHVAHDGTFFVQLETDAAYRLAELSQNISAVIEAQGKTPLSPEYGLKCCAFSPKDQTWYRALISDVAGSKVTVYYVDYGNTEEISLDNLNSPIDSLFDNPYQATCCSLSDFIPLKDGCQALPDRLLDKEFHGSFVSRSSQRHPYLSFLPCNNLTVFQDESSTESLAQLLVADRLGQYRVCTDDIKIGSRQKVYTCFHDSPGKFWVQLTSCLDSLDKVMEDLNDPNTVGRLEPLPSEAIQPGVACCCQYSEDNRYHRAEIIARTKTLKKFKVSFVDYGNCEVVEQSDIKQLPPRLTLPPFFAIQCCLNGVTPVKQEKPDPKHGSIAWNPKACDAFASLTKDKELDAVFVNEFSPEIFNVKLIDPAESNVEIAHLLAQSGHANLSVEYSETPAVATVEDYQYRNLDVGKTYKDVFVTYAESPSVVWCQLPDQQAEFESLTVTLSEFALNLPPCTGIIEVNQPCCIKYYVDESWCRGSISSIDNSSGTAQVFFVDFGNTETVNLDDIKECHPDFFTLPAQAVSFSLAKMSPVGGEWSQGAINSFKELVVNQSLTCEVVGLDEDGYPSAKLVNHLEHNMDIGLELIRQGHARAPLGKVSSESGCSGKNQDTQFVQQSRGSNLSASTSNSKTSSRERDHSPFQSKKASPSHSFSSGESKTWSKERHPSNRSTGSNSSSRSHPTGSKDSPSRSSYHGSRDQSPSVHRSSRYRRVRLQTGETYKVSVCHVESLNEFYCQLLKNAVSLRDLMESIDQHCNSSNARPVSSPRQGMPILAKFTGDGVWYRALVKSPSDKGCRVIFTDYGNSETVPLSSLIEIPPSFINLESQAIQCALIGIPRSFNPPESTVDAFGEMTIDNDYRFSVKKFVRDKELNVGELLCQDGSSLLDQLVEKGLVPTSSSRGSSSSSDKESRKSHSRDASPRSPKRDRQTQSTGVPLPLIPLSESVDVISSFTGSPTLYYLQLSENYLGLEQLSTSINDFYSGTFDYEHKLSRPQVGDFCACLFSEDGLWYRARITSVTKAGVEVVYIDYGNSETVNTASLKILHPQFISQPAVAIPCSLAGLTSSSEAVAQEFVKRITDCQLVAQFQQPLTSYDTPVSVKLYDTSIPDKDVDIAEALTTTSIAKSSQTQVDVLIAPVTPVINSPMECTVSFVVNPGEFYCQLSSETEPFDNLMNKLYAYYAEQGEGEALRGGAVVGAYCAAPYSDESWYRGRITAATSSGQVSVYYIDYGNTDKVETEKLHELAPEFYGLPAQALRCRLVSLTPVSDQWSDASTTKFQEFIPEGKTPQVTFVNQVAKGSFEVQLSVDGKDISQLLVERGLARMQKSEKAITPLTQNLTISHYPATVGARYNVTVTFAESPHEFFCQVLDPEEKLDALMSEIDVYCRDPSTMSPAHFTWKSGDFALAQFSEDSMWYRACISNVLKSGTAFNVYYIDYGNNEMVSSNQLRLLKPQFCRLPYQAIKCRLNGSEVYTCTKENSDRFSDLILNNEFEIACALVSSEGVCAVDMKRRSDSIDMMGLALDENIFVPRSLEPKLLPNLDSVTSSKEQWSTADAKIKMMFPNDVSPDSFHDVVVSHIESPSLLFCQFSLYMAKHLDLLMNLLQEYYTSSTGSAQRCLKSAECKVGMFAAAQYSADDLWYRAILTTVQKSDVEVFFVDFGNREFVPFSKVKQLNSEFAKLPAQAIPCCLAELAPAGGNDWNNEVTDKLYELVYGKSIVAQIRGHSDLSEMSFNVMVSEVKLEVSLIDSSVGIDSDLISCGMAVHVSPAPSPVPTHTAIVQETGNSTKTCLTFPTFTIGQVCESSVSLIDSPSSFWIQLPSAEDNLAILNDKMAVCYTSDRVDHLASVSTVGSICCAKYSEDESWYRGVVKSISSKGVEVCFVDYGNSEVITPSDVKVLESKFQALPVQAIECKLYNCFPLPDSETWSDNAIGVFSHLVLDKDLSIKFVAQVDNVWEVEVNCEGEDVTAQLLHTGLVASPEMMAEVSETPPEVALPVVITAVELQPGHTYPVYIAFNDAPNKFYCQLVSDSDKLENLMAEIADFYNGNHLEPLIEVNAYCVAQYSGNSAWYRAKIVSIDPNGEVEVHFIDYGNSENVLPNQILALESRFTSLPAQALCCTLLPNVSDIQFPQNVLDTFFSLDLTQEFKIKVTGSAGERHLVNLYDPSGYLINDSILRLCEGAEEVMLSTPLPLQSQSQSQSQLQLPPQSMAPSPPQRPPLNLNTEQLPATKQDQSNFPLLKYHVGQTLDVYISHVYSPTSFYCQPLELTADLDNMMAKLGAFTSGGGPLEQLDANKFQPGQVCIARYSFDQELYRAKVEGEVDGEILITFVDYGNCESTSPENIFQIPPQFLSVPTQAIHCSVFDGLDASMEWSKEQVTQFQGLIPESDHLNLKICGVSGIHQQYFVEISGNGEKMEFSSLLEQQIDQATAAQIAQGFSEIKESHTFKPIPRNEENQLIDHTDYLKPSVRTESESENGETEESDTGSEGKPLIKAPFKLSLAVTNEVVDVNVVYVHSPTLLYVQRVDCQSELISLRNEIEQYCGSFGEVEQEYLQPFHSGDFVLAKFSDDGLWYRAEVIGVDLDGTAQVTFIDYGKKEIISPKDLMMCPENLLELPVQAIPCTLAKVPRRDSWPSSYKELIDSLVTDRVLKATVMCPASDGMITTVTLENAEAGVNVSQSVLEKLQDECEMSTSDIITEEPEQIESPEDILPDLQEEEKEVEALTTRTTALSLPTQDLLLPGTTHEVYVVSCSSPFSFVCQLASISEELDSIATILAELYSGPDEGRERYALKTAPREGELVVALFSDDGQWYRAVISKSCEDGQSCEVLFVDYGNSDMVPFENLRTPDPSLATHPPLAFECYLDGLQTLKCYGDEEDSETNLEQKAAEEMSHMIGEDICSAEIMTVDSSGRLGVILTTSTTEKNVGQFFIEAKLVSKVQTEATVNVDNELHFTDTPNSDKQGSVAVADPDEIHVLTDVLQEIKTKEYLINPGEEKEKVGKIQDDLTSVLSLEHCVSLPKREELQPATTHEVYIVSCAGPHSFVCQLSDKSDELDSITTLLAKLYCKEGEGEVSRLYVLKAMPKEGDFVVALFSQDQEWYRAIVTKSCDGENACQVLFIDYGNSETVSLQDLHAPDPCLATQPPLAMECFLSGIQAPTTTTDAQDELNKMATDKFLSLVNEASCSMEILTIDGSGRLGVVLSTSTGVNLASSLIAAKLASPLMPTPSTDYSGDSVELIEDEETPLTEDKQASSIEPSVTNAIETNEFQAPLSKKEDIEEPLPPTTTSSEPNSLSVNDCIPELEGTKEPVSTSDEPITAGHADIQASCSIPKLEGIDETSLLTASDKIDKTDDNGPEIATSFSKPSLEVGKRYSAQVISVSSLEEFLCRLATKEKELQQLLEDIRQQSYTIGEESALSVSTPKKGLPVVACSSKDDSWQRGEIECLGRTSNTVSVLYVDRGDTETLPLERVRHLEKMFADALPTLCVTCGLPVLKETDLNPKSFDGEPWELMWPVSSVKQFSQLTNRKTMGEGSELYLEIIDASDDDNFVVNVIKTLPNGGEFNVRNALVEKFCEPQPVPQFDDNVPNEMSDSVNTEKGQEEKDVLADGELQETQQRQATTTTTTTSTSPQHPAECAHMSREEALLLGARTPSPQPDQESGGNLDPGECSLNKKEVTCQQHESQDSLGNNNDNQNIKPDVLVSVDKPAIKEEPTGEVESEGNKETEWMDASQELSLTEPSTSDILPDEVVPADPLAASELVSTAAEELVNRNDESVEDVKPSLSSYLESPGM